MVLWFDSLSKFPSLPIYHLLVHSTDTMRSRNKPSGSLKKKLRKKTITEENKEKALDIKFRASDLPEEEIERLLFKVFDILLY